jgi:hypothetical protein
LQLVLESFSNSENEKKKLRSPEGSRTCKVKSEKKDKLLGKRKRKTEREIAILRRELVKNMMWTRESIKDMRKMYEEDFSMSEQQIYKWWWDQTRKRAKRGDDTELAEDDS